MIDPSRPTVQIDIRGNHHRSGKTTIAAIIANALEDYGFDNVEVINQDGDFPATANQLPTVNTHTETPRLIITDNNRKIAVKSGE